MPKARRSKLVHLTQVKKKPSQDKKQELISSIQGYLNNFTHIYVVKADNLRTHLLQAVREAMKPDTK